MRTYDQQGNGIRDNVSLLRWIWTFRAFPGTEKIEGRNSRSGNEQCQDQESFVEVQTEHDKSIEGCICRRSRRFWSRKKSDALTWSREHFLDAMVVGTFPDKELIVFQFDLDYFPVILGEKNVPALKCAV